MYPTWLIQGFQDVVNDCVLTDMEMSGYPYTWKRGRGIDNWIEIKLDIALVSKEWTNTFHEARLTKLELSTLDHCPLWLEPKVEKITVRSKRF